MSHLTYESFQEAMELVRETGKPHTFGIDYALPGADRTFYGIQFISEPSMVDRYQFRFPRSKKRRIRKKWAKRAKNFRSTPQPFVYWMKDQNLMIGHPSIISEIPVQ